ncbi:MAG: hypothetical protein ACOYVD_01240 [Bacillota bacterium]
MGKIVFCKSELCGTNKIDLDRLKDLKKSGFQVIEFNDLCGKLTEVNSLTEDLIIVGCNGKVIKGKVDENNKKIVFADIREQCIWQLSDEETLYKEILLQVRLALHRLKFKKRILGIKLQAFDTKMTNYLNEIQNLGPNPFKA